MWHSCPTTRNKAVDMSGKGNVAGFLYLPLYVYLCIVPPLGAVKSQLGGTCIVPLLVYNYIVTVSCDFKYIYICIFIMSFARKMHSTPKLAMTVLSKCAREYSLLLKYVEYVKYKYK